MIKSNPSKECWDPCSLSLHWRTGYGRQWKKPGMCSRRHGGGERDWCLETEVTELQGNADLVKFAKDKAVDVGEAGGFPHPRRLAPSKEIGLE